MNDNPPEGNPSETVDRQARRIYYAVLGSVCALVIGVYAWSAKSGCLELANPSAEHSYYNLLEEGLRAGQLNLKREVPLGLAQRTDFYDPLAGSWLLELSSYRGKLYLYFGITPALVLFWPYVAVTGHYLLHKDAVAIFFSVGFLASVGLLWAVWRRYFAAVGVGVVVACALAVGLANFVTAILVTSDVHEVAISCGYMLAMLALAGLWRSLHDSRRRSWWLAAASLAYGLAVGARPSLLFGALILLVPVAMLWRERAAPGPRPQSRTLWLAATGPITAIGLGLLLYNFLRFGTPLEFGQRYQLPAGPRQQFGLHYLWFNFRVCYLEPALWGSHFPFVHAIAVPPLPRGSGGVFGAFGMLANAPVVWLALTAPVAWCGRQVETRSRLRWFLAAAALLFGTSALMLCLHDSMVLRYEVEFAGMLVLLAVLGIFALERALVAQPVWWRAARLGWGLLLAFSVSFNLCAMFGRFSEFYVFRGVISEHRGMKDEAVFEFQKALAWQPGNTEARVGLGLALSRQGKAPEAIRQIEEAVRLNPDSADSHNSLGTVLFKVGRVGEAIGQYEQALRIKPDFAEANDNLAVALVQRGQVDEAIRHYEEALRLDPKFARAHNNLGVVLFQQAKLAEAIGHYEQALRSKPDFADAHLNLGDALSQQGKVAEAIGHYEQVLRINPDSAEAHASLAGALAERGQMAEAVQHYDASLRLKPDVAENHNNLGVVLFRQGKAAEGIAHLKEALRLKPDYVQARNNLRAALRQ